MDLFNGPLGTGVQRRLTAAYLSDTTMGPKVDRHLCGVYVAAALASRPALPELVRQFNAACVRTLGLRQPTRENKPWESPR